MAPNASLVSRWPLVAIGLSVFLASLGTSIANVGMPTLANQFGASAQQAQWVVIAYLVASTALIVGAGRLGDLFGRRRMLLVGIAVFTLASALCAVSTNLPLLIAARAVQGGGAAMMLAQAMALAGDILPHERIGRAMGILGTMSAIGTAMGPPLGGALIAASGWQSLFAIGVPLGALTAMTVVGAVPIDRQTISNRRFDLAGTLALAASLACYSLAMTLNGGFGVINVALLTAAVAGMLLFLRIEARSTAPLVDLRMLSEPHLRAGLALAALVATVVMATLVVGPFYLTADYDLTAATLGAVMSIGPAVAALVGVPSGRLVDLLGAPTAVTLGLCVTGTGALLLATLPSSAGSAGYAAALAMLTAGYALFQAANNAAVMSAANADRRGMVSSLLGLARNLGLVTGASAMGALYAAASSVSPATGLHITFAVASALIAAALILHLGQMRSTASDL